MSWSKGLVAASGMLALAASAAAEPLTYVLQRDLLQVTVDGQLQTAFVPPPGVPLTSVTTDGISSMTARPSGTAQCDTGLPDSFNGGTQEGIYIDIFEAHVDVQEAGVLLTDLFAPLVAALPPGTLPVPLVGFAGVVDIADLDVSMVAPLSSNLFSLPDPNEYDWAGVAGLRISGTLNLIVAIPGQDPIAVSDPIPFDQVVNPAALAGSFGGDTVGDPTSTTLWVGLEEATVTPDTSALQLGAIVIPLGAVGSVTVTPRNFKLKIIGNFRGVNRIYGLPNQTVTFPPGAGCGIGPELAAVVPLLAWLHGRRRRA